MQPCGMQNRSSQDRHTDTTKLRESGEDYLVAVFILQRQKAKVRCIDLARYTGYSKPSISHAVSLLQKGGFLKRDAESCLHLTKTGRQIAEQMYEKRSFFTQMLMQAGVDAQSAQRDACKIEHISEDSFQKLKTSIKRSGIL